MGSARGEDFLIVRRCLSEMAGERRFDGGGNSTVRADERAIVEKRRHLRIGGHPSGGAL